MSTTIEIGRIEKKVNSTGIAGFNASITAACVLKDNCDIKNPTIQVRGSAGNYNYMKWGDRYYWVDKIVPIPNGIIEVTAHLDPLGTYKNDIEMSSVFATYAKFPVWDKTADDPRMSPDIPEETSSNSVDVFDFSMTPNNGTVILTVFQCGDASGTQGVRTYALSLPRFRQCLRNLTTFLNDEGTPINDAVNDIDRTMGNITGPYTDDVKAVMASTGVWQNAIGKLVSGVFADLAGGGSWRDNIIKAIYVPIPTSVYGDVDNNGEYMYVGTIRCGKEIPVPTSNVKIANHEINIPWGSKVDNYPFLRLPKYSQLQIVCMGGYYQTIDGTYLTKDDSSVGITLESKVTVHSSIDICSGDWSISINKGSSSNALKLGVFSGNCSIDITGAIGKGGTGQVMQTINTIGQLAAGAATAGSVTSFLHAGEQFALSNTPVTGIQEKFNGNVVAGMNSGSAGGGIASMFLSGGLGKADFRGFCFIPKIISDNAYTDYCNEYGYPCNTWIRLGTMTNCTVKCSGASIKTNASQMELAYINSICNNGIYIEA